MRFRVPLLLICIIVVQSGCTETIEPPTGPATRILNLSAAAWPWSIGIAGAEAPAPEVRVVDDANAPIPGQLVLFEVTTGAGRIEVASALSDASGTARPGTWILGDEPGVNVLAATLAADGSRRVEFRVAAQSRCAAPCVQGQRVAFVRGGNIYVADPDGSNAVQLTSTGTFANPAWSPDGRHIAFTDQWGGERIYLMRTDGSSIRYFASGSTPSWSPGGERIAYATLSEGKSRIFVQSVTPMDEPPVRIRFEGEYDSWQPTWSPAGDRIAFVSVRAHSKFARDVYVADPDGSNLVPITGSFESGQWIHYHQPAWSPDGHRLAVVECTGWLVVDEGFGEEIVPACDSSSKVGVIAIDAGGFQLLAQTPPDARPTWTSDGSAVAFARRCADQCVPNVFLVSLQSHEQLLIPDAHSPAWRP